jgi:hypothetical protein
MALTRSFVLIAAFALILSGAAGKKAKAQSLAAGQWQTRTQVLLNGLPLPPNHGSECVTTDTTKNLQSKLAEELAKSGCKIDKWNLQGQTLITSLSCDQDDIQAQGDIKGTVTDKSYQLQGQASGNYKGIPAVATLKLTGQWTGSCSGN